MPTPASESAEAFASPVPAYSVLAEASFGSSVSAPIALLAKLPETNSQPGLPERAFVVRQMPPPAAATHIRQLCLVQLGAIAMAVTRPAVTYAAWSPRKLSTAGYVALLGPISDQAPEEEPPAWRAFHAARAAVVCAHA